MSSISVVIPVYQCGPCLPELIKRLTTTLRSITKNHEIIMVNDGSFDGSWKKIESLAKKNKHIRGINLSRNFGQHYAISAGLDHANKDWIVVMDCDLQDRPEEIKRLYKRALDGYDVVLAHRENRKDNPFKQLSSALFSYIFELLSDIKSDPTIGNFSITSKKVINAYKTMNEKNRSFLQLVKWMGFTHGSISVKHAPRFAGKSTYTFRKSLSYAFESIVAHSNKPLKISVFVGLLISLVSFVYGAFMLTRYFIQGIPILGYTSTFVSLYFLSGLIIANLGVVGLYIGKIFDEVKQRPLYIIKDTINVKTKQ